jgi:hypothetical protein
MKKNIVISSVLLLSFTLLSANHLKAQVSAVKDTFYLIFLGGQSNMDGYGYNKDLPEELKSTFSNTWIFHGHTEKDDTPGGGVGMWEKLKPGHGVGFSASSTQNSLSERFGVELTFAQHLEKQFPGQKIALIKYSRGGTSIDSLAASYFGCWEPDFKGRDGINQYDHFLTTLQNAFNNSDLDNNGIEDVLVPKGILWMQGEADASFDVKIAHRYGKNLKRLMDLIRAALWTDDLSVVIGKISDSQKYDRGIVWLYGDLVRQAQEDFVKADSNAAIVRSTDFYSYSDPWHYNSAGYIDLGEKFAQALISLMK